MKIRQLLKCGLVAAVILVASQGWAADETNKQKESREVDRGPVFDISFPGGTLADFVAYVDKVMGTSVQDAKRPNLLVPDELKKSPVPKLELRAVDVNTLMSAMGMLLRGDYSWQRVGSSSTWVLMTRPDARKTQAYYIGHLLKRAAEAPPQNRPSRGFKVADVTTALETVWQMDSTVKPELKYHEDTQMLVIRADSRQIQMAENVLNQLRGGLAEQTIQEEQERAKTATPAAP
jgi:hypothetical protein